jgi:hypothetical protein
MTSRTKELFTVHSLDYYLRKSSHVALHDVRMWTFQLLDDAETLIELSENIGHRTGKQGVR